MKHLKLFEDFIDQIDKGYTDENIGILYNPTKKLLFFGSNKKEGFTFCIKDVQTEEEVEQIKNTLEDIDPIEWENNLREIGYEFLPSNEYFN
jgi:hypothetical protein